MRNVRALRKVALVASPDCAVGDILAGCVAVAATWATQSEDRKRGDARKKPGEDRRRRGDETNRGMDERVQKAIDDTSRRLRAAVQAGEMTPEEARKASRERIAAIKERAAQSQGNARRRGNGDAMENDVPEQVGRPGLDKQQWRHAFDVAQAFSHFTCDMSDWSECLLDLRQYADRALHQLTLPEQ